MLQVARWEAEFRYQEAWHVIKAELVIDPGSCRCRCCGCIFANLRCRKLSRLCRRAGKYLLCSTDRDDISLWHDGRRTDQREWSGVRSRTRHSGSGRPARIYRTTRSARRTGATRSGRYGSVNINVYNDDGSIERNCFERLSLDFLGRE